jgi:hypothetical protein
MASAPDPILLREQEAAAMMAMSARNLRKLRKAGEVDFVSIGARIFYLREDLITLATRHRTCESTDVKAPPTGGTRSPTRVSDIGEARKLREKLKRRR